MFDVFFHNVHYCLIELFGLLFALQPLIKQQFQIIRYVACWLFCFAMCANHLYINPDQTSDVLIIIANNIQIVVYYFATTIVNTILIDRIFGNKYRAGKLLSTFVAMKFINVLFCDGLFVFAFYTNHLFFIFDSNVHHMITLCRINYGALYFCGF